MFLPFWSQQKKEIFSPEINIPTSSHIRKISDYVSKFDNYKTVPKKQISGLTYYY